MFGVKNQTFQNWTLALKGNKKIKKPNLKFFRETKFLFITQEQSHEILIEPPVGVGRGMLTGGVKIIIKINAIIRSFQPIGKNIMCIVQSKEYTSSSECI